MSAADVAFDLFKYALDKEYVETLAFLAETFDLTLISNDNIDQAFVHISKAENANLLQNFCESPVIDRVSEKAIHDAFLDAISCASIEKVSVLVTTVKTKEPHISKIEHAFLKAAGQENTAIIDLLRQSFDIPDNVFHLGILEAFKCGMPRNARHIMSEYTLQQAKEMQILSQEIFIAFCEGDSSHVLSEVLQIFDREQILHDTQQQGILLSLGNPTTDILLYLLEEFEHPWISDDVLEKLILVSCQCPIASADKLSLLLTFAGLDNVPLYIWETTVFESIRNCNSDTLGRLLEMHVDKILSSTTLEKAVEASIQMKSATMIKALHTRFGFDDITESRIQDLFLLTVEVNDIALLNA